MQCAEGWILVGARCVHLGTFALLSVSVGGWIVGWISRAYFERRSSREARREKQQSIEREAIELALRWIDPMTLAITSAESVTQSYLFGDIGEDQFRSRWPSTLDSTLAKLDIPSHLRAYLPVKAQQRGIAIVSMFPDLFVEALRAHGKGLNTRFRAIHYSYDIHREIDSLRDDLEAAHRKALE